MFRISERFACRVVGLTAAPSGMSASLSRSRRPSCGDVFEFAARALQRCCKSSGTTTAYIEPSSPRQNGFAESFNSRFRDEFLNTELFAAVAEAQSLASRWRWECIILRSHSALQGRTPLEAAQAAAA